MSYILPWILNARLSWNSSQLFLCSFFFLIADMDGTSGSSLFPLHRCKTLHLVRVWAKPFSSKLRFIFCTWVFSYVEPHFLFFQYHMRRSGMRREFITWKVRRTLRHTCLLNFLMLILHLWVGIRLEFYDLI